MNCSAKRASQRAVGYQLSAISSEMTPGTLHSGPRSFASIFENSWRVNGSR